MSEREMTQEGVLDAIQAGEMDDVLVFLEDAITARKYALNRAAVGAIKVGDRVRISDEVSPKYMAGVECTVVKVNDAALKVTVDRDQGRFKAGAPIRLPKSLVVAR